MKSKLVAASILAASSTIASESFQQSPSKISSSVEEPCELKLGWGEWSPYQYSDQPSGDNKTAAPTLIDESENTTEPKGIQIELIKTIASEAGCQLTYVQQNFTQNLKSIENGTIDFTLDSTITEARKQFAYFSEPYRNEVLVLYVRSQFLSQCQSQTLEKLINNGLRLGLTIGNIYGELITAIQNDTQLNAKLHYQAKNAFHFAKLKARELDAVLEDPAVMSYQMRRDKSIGTMKSCKVTVQSSPVSLMFSKKTVSKAILTRMNEALKKVKKTESYIANWSW